MPKNKNYHDFVDRFKPKKTTDDCYTPDVVYDSVRDYVVDKFNVDKSQIIRPFWPGGDYEHEDYTGKVVVDNPPFSLMSQIIKFYMNNDVKFFLFAPALTLFSSGKKYVGKFTYMPVSASIVYQNGANVSTSFVTNLFKDDTLIYADPKLLQIVEKANKQSQAGKVHHLPKYSYPNNLLRVTDIIRLIKWGGKESLSVRSSEAQWIRMLDEQKQYKKEIFGGGFLVSDSAMQRVQALKRQALKRKALSGYTKSWHLSEREREIIKKLNENSN